MKDSLRKSYDVLKKEMQVSELVHYGGINEELKAIKKCELKLKENKVRLAHFKFLRLQEKITKISSYLDNNIIFNLYCDENISLCLKFENSKANYATIVNFLTMLGYEFNSMPQGQVHIKLSAFSISKVHVIYNYLEKNNYKYAGKANGQRLLKDVCILRHESEVRSGKICIKIQTILHKVFMINEKIFQVFDFYKIGNCIYYKDSSKLLYLCRNIKSENKNLDKSFNDIERITLSFFDQIIDAEFLIKPYFEYYQMSNIDNNINFNRLLFDKTTLIGFRLTEKSLDKINYLYSMLVSDNYLKINKNTGHTYPIFNKMCEEEKFSYLKLLYDNELNIVNYVNDKTSFLVSKSNFISEQGFNEECGWLFHYKKKGLQKNNQQSDIEEKSNCLQHFYSKLNVFFTYYLIKINTRISYGKENK